MHDYQPIQKLKTEAFSSFIVHEYLDLVVNLGNRSHEFKAFPQHWKATIICLLVFQSHS